MLLPDPCDEHCPADFKANARELLAKRFSKSVNTDEALQQLLLEFIGEFANWDHAANALYLEIGRGLVKAAHPEETPVVVGNSGNVAVGPLPNLGTVSFSAAQTNSANAGLIASEAIQLIDSNGTPLATPSAPNATTCSNSSTAAP